MSSIFALSGVIAGVALFSDPPPSCLKLAAKVHQHYNANDFGPICDEMGRESGPEMREEWLDRCSRMRQVHGRFVREIRSGYMLSFRSLTSVSVELWITSDFETGRKREHLQILTGLFQSPRLVGFEVQDAG